MSPLLQKLFSRLLQSLMAAHGGAFISVCEVFLFIQMDKPWRKQLSESSITSKQVLFCSLLQE